MKRKLLWLDRIRSEIDADRLLQRLGAEVTSYGIVSKQHGSLFALTGYDELEKYELIEICGQKALMLFFFMYILLSSFLIPS